MEPVVLDARPEASLLLYCLPPAGSGPGYYRSWVSLVPPWVELRSLQLPGRGDRSTQPSMTDPLQLGAHIAAAISACEKDRPYVLFGHSAGALLAYVTVRHLRDLGARLPRLLAVSALPAPHLGAYTAALPARLAAGLQGLRDLIGPIPEELLDTPAAAAVCTTVLADLLLLLHYRHQAAPPLDIPLALYGGEHDPVTTTAELEAWNALVTAPVRPRLFPGAHTYPAQHSPALLHQLTTDISNLLTTPG
ncbi:thioesterase domain-containing protein [Streptomyces sp. NPDC086554]|uniref:thioesterase II family protein n=1 Tax=Streptomyces sp. NPDC086554 TaxID=3154864 RepID=UPI0034137BAA